MTTEKKMVKRDWFELIKKELPTNATKYDEIIAFVDHELELLAKKNTSEKKPTSTQLENEKIKKAIINTMEVNRLYTITELQKEVELCNELSNQRVSALVKQLLADDLVVRTEDKRKAYFSLKA